MVLAAWDYNLISSNNRDLLTVEAEEAGTRGYVEELFLVRVKMKSRNHDTVVLWVWSRLARRERKGNRRLCTLEIRIVVEGYARAAILHLES
jgi:hypothetical protein